jgi:hypothetical protein
MEHFFYSFGESLHTRDLSEYVSEGLNRDQRKCICRDWVTALDTSNRFLIQNQVCIQSLITEHGLVAFLHKKIYCACPPNKTLCMHRDFACMYNFIHHLLLLFNK